MKYTLNPGPLLTEGIDNTLQAVEQLLLDGAPQVCIQKTVTPLEVGSRFSPHHLDITLDSCTVSVVLNTRPEGAPMGYGNFLRLEKPTGAHWTVGSAGLDTALVFWNESVCPPYAWVTPAEEFLVRTTVAVDSGSNHATCFTDYYNTGVLTVGNLTSAMPGPILGVTVGAIEPLGWTVLVREISIWSRSFTINEWLSNTQPPDVRFVPEGVGPNGWVSTSGQYSMELGD